MKMQMVEINDDYTHVKLEGRMDVPGIQQIDLPFTTQVASARLSSIVDMTEVTFLASYGIRTLLTTARSLHRAGCLLVVVNPQPEVRRVLELARLGDALDIVDTLKAAKHLIRTA